MLKNNFVIALINIFFLFTGNINQAIADSTQIIIENMTSVEIGHLSQASILIKDMVYTLLPDQSETIQAPINMPILISLNSLSFENELMDPTLFSDCNKTVVLQKEETLHMYMVGKVPDGIIECRYY